MHPWELGLDRGGMDAGTMHDGLDGLGDPFKGLLVRDEDMKGSDHLDAGQLPDMKIVNRKDVGNDLDLCADLFNIDTNWDTLHENKGS